MSLGSRANAGEGLGALGWLETSNRRYRLPSDSDTAAVGRDPGAAIALTEDTVSWLHAEIGIRDGALMIWDCGSHNGTLVDGRHIDEHGVRLRHGAVIRLGELEMRFVKADQEGATGLLPQLRRYRLADDLRIGRAEENDIVLDEANVSRNHAVLRFGPPMTIQDLGSRNGTWLGHQRIRQAQVNHGDEIGVGPYRLSVDDTAITVSDQRTGGGLRALNVGVRAGSATILQPTSLTVGRGELVALIGPSGAGKSTLLHALAGISLPTEGEVLIDDDPIETRLSDIGFVPQQDIIHERLTVREALTYAASLRLPKDTAATEIAQTVNHVVDVLGLTDRATTQLSSLSGGQRKRAAAGIELVGHPSILLLDEPTSGLDPQLEHQLMETIRQLADNGRGVVVTTHATSSLALCDTLAIMASGGQLAYVGRPQDALRHFEVQHYDQLYQRIPHTPELTLDGSVSLPHRLEAVRPPTRLATDHSFWRHLSVFSLRYMRTFMRDRRTLITLLGQVPIIALLIVLLFSSHPLSHPDGDPGKSAQFAFLLVTAAIWLGLISSCREFVNERSIILRELAIGARLTAYLGAKVIILFLLSAVQVALLLSISTALHPLHEPPSAYLTLYMILTCTAWAAIAMGLVVSTFARSVDQATSFVPLLLIPQLLFAGALVTVKSMESIALKVISDLTVARWAFAGGGSAIDMNGRYAEEPHQMSPYGQSFFSLKPGLAMGMILLFVVAGLLVAAGLLRVRSAQPG
jgi:ABC transport system ATP-binding/permease protein